MARDISRFYFMMILLSIGWADMKGQTNETVSLKAGDPAPPIVVRKWIKGSPVTTFTPGKVYVVEFWATWCGPCQAAMPHLSELARKYKGKAEVISFDVKEDKKTDFLPKVERFVKWSGDRMDYAVAVDAPDDIMEKTWLKAAGSSGIPEVFVIDQQGKIAWHGHPNIVDDVLDAVVNGPFDEAAKLRINATIKAKDQLYDSLSHKMMAARKAGDYKAALAIVEEILPVFPGLHSYCSNMKYEFLSHIDSIKARQYAEVQITHPHPKDQVTFVYSIIFAQPDGAYKPDYEFALKVIRQAVNRWNPQDNSILSLLAQAYYKTGDKEQAVKQQQIYIDMLKKDTATNPKALEQAEKILAHYKS